MSWALRMSLWTLPWLETIYVGKVYIYINDISHTIPAYNGMGTPNSGNQNIQQMTKILWVQVATEIVKQFTVFTMTVYQWVKALQKKNMYVQSGILYPSCEGFALAPQNSRRALGAESNAQQLVVYLVYCL